MENTNEDTVESIPFDSLINIQVSGAYLQKLKIMLLQLYENKDDIREVPVILAELSQREPENMWEFHVITILALVKEIEDSAKKQKLIVSRPQQEFIEKYTEEYDKYIKNSEESSPEN